MYQVSIFFLFLWLFIVLFLLVIVVVLILGQVTPLSSQVTRGRIL